MVHYTDDESEERRRILLDPRWDPAQLQRSIDAFREAGLPLRIDDAVHEVAPDITWE